MRPKAGITSSGSDGGFGATAALAGLSRPHFSGRFAACVVGSEVFDRSVRYDMVMITFSSRPLLRVRVSGLRGY